MSAPARKLPAPARKEPGTGAVPARRTAPRPNPDRAAPQRRPATRQRKPQQRPRAASRARLRRGRIGFAVILTLVVVPMIVGLVALNAVLAQTSFRIDDLTTRVDELGERNAELRKDVAVRSAPDRIADWAGKQGMVTPDPHDVHVLHPPARGRGADPENDQ